MPSVLGKKKNMVFYNRPSMLNFMVIWTCLSCLDGLQDCLGGDAEVAFVNAEVDDFMSSCTM